MFSHYIFTIITSITLKSNFTKKREGYMNMHMVSYMIVSYMMFMDIHVWKTFTECV